MAFRIDSHKLMFHPGRVMEWLQWGDVFPIYAEVSPSGTCNHRCSFCAMDFMKYRKRFLDVSTMATQFQDMSLNGLKSVMFGGEGEPFLHPEFSGLVKSAYDAGLDIGITTNGVLFDKPEEILPYCKWIKISCNAGINHTYMNVHHAKDGDFKRFWNNLSLAVTMRAEKKFNCTIGIQSLLLIENDTEINTLATRAKSIGLDYLVVKPFSKHPKSNKAAECGEPLQRSRVLSCADDKFKVVWRDNAMSKIGCDRGYNECHAMPFWSYIDSGGNVWGCSSFLGDERFKFGNINTAKFSEIWKNRKRPEFDISECREACRMDECNKYLNEFKQPGSHINFI